MKQSDRRIPKRLGVSSAVALLCIGQILYLARQTHFTEGQKRTGEFLEQEIRNSPPWSKVLIENPNWSYLNVVVASQHPDKFIFNSGFNPYEAHRAVVDPETTLTPLVLREKQIGYLALSTTRYRNYVGQYRFVKEVRDFGEWSIYKIVGEP